LPMYGCTACCFRGGDRGAFLVKLALFASIRSRTRLAGEIIKIGRRLGSGVLLNIDREADSEKARQRADCELDEGFHSFWNATCCHLVFVFVVSVLGAARL